MSAPRPTGETLGPGAAAPPRATEPTGTGPTDHDLVRRAQKGDEDAFALLVHRHQERAFRVARALVGSRDDAADLVQEAFVRVFRSLARFDFEHEFATWLHRIVTNLAIDLLRKRRPAVSTSAASRGDEEAPDLDLPDGREEEPGAAAVREETVAQVRACIDTLAPHFRVVMALRELEGLPCTEIAKIVGATHVTVRWRLHRGRRLFQEAWERMERRTEAAPALGGDSNNPSEAP